LPDANVIWLRRVQKRLVQDVERYIRQFVHDLDSIPVSRGLLCG
jgi:hypothetical protein